MPYRFSADPDPDALSYFQVKRTRPSFDHRDVWREEHIAAWTVAKGMETDVLRTIREQTEQALAEGKTFERFRTELTPTLQRLGWWGRQPRTDPLTGLTRAVQLGSPRRLSIIYRTNLRTARAAGQWERIQGALTTHPYLLYTLGPSRVHRDQHVAWSGLLLPVSESWWRTHMPPNGWGCRCRVRQVSTGEAGRMQVDTAPPLERQRYVNSRTGQVTYPPKGVQPGWDYNPGIDRTDRLRKDYEARRKELRILSGIEMPDPQQHFDF